MESTFNASEPLKRDGVIPEARIIRLRINEPFCSDRDMSDVARGKVVYPGEMRLDWTPPAVVAGGHVLSLSDTLEVIEVH